MTRRSRRSPWPWVAIGLLGLVVAVFVGAFVWRLLDPPVTPYVESSDGFRRVIQCDVVNASGRQGAGRSVLTFLRERGFDVVELSTAPERQRRSSVIDRVGDRTIAVKLATVLGIADTLVEPQIDSMLFVHASVVLGEDVGTLLPFQD
jgi:hypothetical protein